MMNLNSIYFTLGLFLIYLIVFVFIFQFKGAVKFKKLLYPPFIILTYTSIISSVYFQDRSIWALLILIVLGIPLCFVIIRYSATFCNACGWAVYDRARFTKPTECPKCGAKLD